MSEPRVTLAYLIERQRRHDRRVARRLDRAIASEQGPEADAEDGETDDDIETPITEEA